MNADIGKEIHVDQAMPPHQQTRITYQGTSWLATNLDSEALKQGDRVVIVGVDGNVLLIRKVN
jgi:membrane protein implicated in regulation of membrane protease activity